MVIRTSFVRLALSGAVFSLYGSASAAELSGEAVYAKNCATCHDQTAARIPSRASLTNLSPARILRTLDFGAMMSIAYPMRRDEREAVARFLGQGAEDPPPPASAFCKTGSAIMSGPERNSWAGWSPDASNARFQSAENAGLAAADVPKLKLKWAYAFAGDVTAFGAPALVNGTLFTGSAGGVVQALDANTGCIHWLYQANGPVRSGMAVVRDRRRDHARVQRSEWLDACHRRENGKTALAQAPRRARGDTADRHARRI